MGDLKDTEWIRILMDESKDISERWETQKILSELEF